MVKITKSQKLEEFAMAPNPSGRLCKSLFAFSILKLLQKLDTCKTLQMDS